MKTLNDTIILKKVIKWLKLNLKEDLNNLDDLHTDNKHLLDMIKEKRKV